MTREPCIPDQGLDSEMVMFLLTKPGVRIVGRVCGSDFHCAEGGCRRPVWMDFGYQGDVLSYCSACWRLHMALHGSYTSMSANPAAAQLMAKGRLNQSAVDRLTGNS